MNPISGIGDFSGLEEMLKTAGTENAKDGTGVSFKEFMLRSIDKVNSMQVDADEAVKLLMTGGEISPAKALTMVQQADMSFRMMQQIRNKLVQAYQEIKEIRI